MDPQERSSKRPLSVLREEANVIHHFDGKSIDAIAVCDYPNEFCSEFCLLVATGPDLSVYNFFDNQKDSTGRSISTRKLKLDRTYSLDKGITHVSLWPLSESRLHPFPIMIAVAFDDFSISLLSDYLSLSHEEGEEPESEVTTVSLPFKHENFINGICFDCTGKFLASISDDHSCRVWNINESSEQLLLEFDSPPVAFKWHQTDHRKFFVFVSSGTVILHNLELQMPVMSLDTMKCSVLDGDWSITDESLVGAVVWKQYCLIWNMSESSLPSEPIKFIPEGKVKHFSWSRVDSKTFAVSTVNQNKLIICSTGDISQRTVIKFEKRIEWINWLMGENTCIVLSGSDLFAVCV